MSDLLTPSSDGLIAVSKVNIRDHFDIEEEKYTCKICKFVYSDRKRAQQHFYQFHNALHGKLNEALLAWRSLFSATGECSLCDYKYKPRRRNTEPHPRSSRTNLLRLRLDTRHAGKRDEMVSAAFDKAIKVARDVAQMYSAGTPNCQSVSVPVEGYPCEECGQSFESPTERLNHRNAVHPRRSKSYQCSSCGKVLASFQALKCHTSRHKYRCPKCDLCFEKKDGIAHAKCCGQSLQQSPIIEQFNCPLCQKSFNAERLLKAHLAMKHKPLQQGPSSVQTAIVKDEIDCDRKRLKLTSEVEAPWTLSETNEQSEHQAQSGVWLEPKEEKSDTASDLHDVIGLAIVKEEEDEYEDNA
uniref:C2H2-type domain-containing protein n=1 Tax=Plectus sambesii TaxID=2011161 RepID=A0A914X9N3_9BILA